MRIADYYKDKSIFITGTTGFLGKVVLEKIMFSCPDFKKIYILIRPKKGKEVQQRMLDDVFDSEIWERCRKLYPGFDEILREKVTAVAGDITEAYLGMSEEDIEMVAQDT